MADQDNPPVTSKFDRNHGEPRSPGKVERPGGVAEPTFADTRHAPTAVMANGAHHYAPDHPAMGGLHHGAKAKHPKSYGRG
jgi:hypothetical protein